MKAIINKAKDGTITVQLASDCNFKIGPNGKLQSFKGDKNDPHIAQAQMRIVEGWINSIGRDNITMEFLKNFFKDKAVKDSVELTIILQYASEEPKVTVQKQVAKKAMTAPKAKAKASKVDGFFFDKTYQELAKIYGAGFLGKNKKVLAQTLTDWLIGADELTAKELADADYIQDRVETHKSLL